MAQRIKKDKIVLARSDLSSKNQFFPITNYFAEIKIVSF